MKKWKKINSKIIHENCWYSLREDDIITPQGKRGKYFVVDINSIAVIAEDEDGKIYLVGQIRYPVGNIFSWEIITGGFKGKVSPLDAAKRELKEETGLTAKHWTKLGYFHPVNGYSSEAVHVYLAKELKSGEQALDETEEIIIKKESLKNIIKMIKADEITCGITIAAIGKYLVYKKLWKN